MVEHVEASGGINHLSLLSSTLSLFTTHFLQQLAIESTQWDLDLSPREELSGGFGLEHALGAVAM